MLLALPGDAQFEPGPGGARSALEAAAPGRRRAGACPFSDPHVQNYIPLMPDSTIGADSTTPR